MAIPTVEVLVAAHDQDGLPSPRAQVTAKLSTVERYNGYVVPDEYSGITDENGECRINLFPNELGTEGSEYKFKIVHTNGKTITVYASIPNNDCFLHQVADLDRFELRGAGQVITEEVSGYANDAITARDQARAAESSAVNYSIIAGGYKTDAEAAAVVAEAHKNEAIASASAAATSAANASTSETNASTSATTANTQRVATEAARDLTLTYRNDAQAARNKAERWAEQAVDVAVETGRYSAKHHAIKASHSASTAATARDNATTKAGEASVSAGQAATSASNAAASAVAASGFANDAKLSRDAASVSAAAVSNNVAIAVTRATEASVSAESASISASAASVSRVSAESARDIAVSASNTAVTAKDAALASAADALGSKNSAATSAANASAASSVASTKANEASASASSASTSASIATTKADESLTSAINAASSAATASSAKTDAESARDTAVSAADTATTAKDNVVTLEQSVTTMHDYMVENGMHDHVNKAVLDAITEAYTTEQKEKLLSDIAVIKWLVSGLNKMVDNPVVAPLLHWDADIDPYVEQMYGPNKFSYNVLGPQYQRNADGSTTEVGAKPAVDVFDGEKWLRSCGAVENLLPSGWPFSNVGIAVSTLNDYVKLEKANVFSSAHVARTDLPAGALYTATITLRAGSGLTGTRFDFGYHNNSFKPIAVSSFSGPGTYVVTPDQVVRISDLSPTEDTTVSFTLTSALETSVNAMFYPCGVSSTEIGASVLIKDFIITATAYPVPYVPPGVTQPASNATTTNGSWFALPGGSPLWQALRGQPLTLATRIRMGVGSGDKLDDVILAASGQSPMYTKTSGENAVFLSYDGTTASSIVVTPFPRNAVIRRFTQVNTAGTQFRVGYMIEGTHTTIQWGGWRAYDGSFNPTTHYRLMLGYNTPYTIWFNKITAWKEQVSDDSILAAMS